MIHPELGSRHLFPDLQARAYLNHASVSPPSVAVRRAVAAMLERYGQRGVGAVVGALEQRERLKSKLARLFGCDPGDLALTGSTNRGLIDLSVCLPLGQGDRVVGFEGEFPANITPWRQAASAVGARFELLPQEGLSDGAVLDALERSLRTGGVRWVAVSAVQYSTGRAMPLEGISALAHAHGALVVVDGIQAAGVVPLDVRALGIDFLAGGAHKWLMGLEGVGYVYAAPGAVERLSPRTAGWLSHEDPVSFLLAGPGHLDYGRPIRRGIDFMEGHSPNAIGCAALEAALDAILHLGVEAIADHVRAYDDRLEAGLVDRGFTSLRTPGPSGTLSVLVPEGRDVIGIARGLAERGISVSTPDGILRFSPHWPNALDEVPMVLEAIDAVL